MDINKIAKTYANKLGYTISDKINTGREATTYNVLDRKDLVIRIGLGVLPDSNVQTTTAKVIYNKLLGKKFKHIANYYDIHKLNLTKSNKSVYGVLMEKININVYNDDIRLFVKYSYEINYILDSNNFIEVLATKDYIPLVKNELKKIFKYNLNEKMIKRLLQIHYSYDKDPESSIMDMVETYQLEEKMANKIEYYFQRKNKELQNEITKLIPSEKVKYVVTAWENLDYISNFVKRQLYGYYKELLSLGLRNTDLDEENIGFDKNGNIKVFDIESHNITDDVKNKMNLDEKIKSGVYFRH